MATLFIPVGISGSGKSRLKRSLKTPKTSVCPDDIRKELTGNISDQSRNNDVFRIALGRAASALERGENVYFDATNLRRDLVDRLISIAEQKNANVQILVLMDSEDIELCRARVQQDISSGVDRSDTSKAEMGIQERQQKAFYSIYPYLHSLEDKGISVLDFKRRSE